MHVDQTLSTLQHVLDDIHNRMNQLSTAISTATLRNKQAYSTFPQKHKCRLHSVLIHQGAAGSGHYWCCIYYPKVTQLILQCTTRTFLTSKNYQTGKKVGKI